MRVSSVLSRLSACLMTTYSTPPSMARKAPSILGIMPLLMVPSARRAAKLSLLIVGITLRSSSTSVSTPFFSRQKIRLVGCICEAPTATAEATLSALLLSSEPCSSCVMAQKTGTMPCSTSEARKGMFILSGTMSPTLREGIGMGYVKAAHAAVGSPITVVIRGKLIKAEVVKAPFV